MAKFNGIHPAEMKITASLQTEIYPVKEGDEFYIPLTQHLGAPAKSIVTKGQQVMAGEKIAEAQVLISADIHASVDGTVTSIDSVDYPVTTKAPCIVIKAGEQSGEYLKISEDITGLADIAKEAGIVGMGGAMFPAHVKLNPPHQLETLIINGAECEPYLTCDHRAMLERASDLIKGSLIIKDALKLRKVTIAVENNKPDAVEILHKQADGQVEILNMKTIYPQGGEKQLIQTVTGREIPEGKLPAELNIIVHNVSTVLAIYDAAVHRKPLISRTITVTGDVSTAKNIKAPLGTPISRLIDFCGGIKPPPAGTHKGNGSYKVVLGGPMTGFSAHSLNIPSYKGMNGILVMYTDSRQEKPIACIRCGRCIQACPVGLSPVMLENFVRNDMYAELYDWKLLSCIECSACNYVCPSGRPLKKLFRLHKKAAVDAAKERENGH